MRIETPGGGGYGEASRRALVRLASDLRSGRVSRATAERDYGVEKVEAAAALAGQKREG
jgi:N-methylhydantoinase B